MAEETAEPAGPGAEPRISPDGDFYVPLVLAPFEYGSGLGAAILGWPFERLSRLWVGTPPPPTGTVPETPEPPPGTETFEPPPGGTETFEPPPGGTEE
jgi:hypothetical protein